MKRPNLFAAVFLMSGIFMEAEPASTTTEVNGTDEPYLLVAANKGIIRINMDGSGYQLFVADVGVVAIDYHYSRDLLFWVTDFSPDLKFTSLSNKTGNITALNIRRINNPTGLAVDWLHDRVYWVEGSSRSFRVYDLVTKEISLIVSISAPSTSRKLKILPHLGLLFWGDRDRNGIFRIPVDGSRHPKQIISLQCPFAMTVSYKTGNIYTVDSCAGTVNSIKIDGSSPEVIISSIGPGFVYGSSIFRGGLFWSQAYLVSAVNCFNINMSTSQEVFHRGSDIFDDVMVVHSSNQPSKAELDQYGLCELVCHHGDCLRSGTCSCNEGWRGLECTIDIDECQVESGGCEQTCVNLPGAFRCECEDGEELLPDKKGCKLAEPGSHTTLSSTLPPTTSAPTITSTHFPTTPFSTTKAPTTTLSTTETPTTPISTTETPTTPLSTTKTPTTPFSSTETPTTPMSTTETPTTSIITTESPTTPLSTTETITTPPSNSSMDVTSSNDQTGTTPPTSNSITDQTTTNSEEISRTEIDFTQKEDDVTSLANNLTFITPDEGGSNLQTKDSNPKEALIVGVITFLSGFVVLTVVGLYVLFLYIKYMKKKTGFYDTFKRHHGLDGDGDQLGKMSESQPRTRFARRSFKDVTMKKMYRNRYSRKQIFEDVADSGCTGGMKIMEGSPTHVQNFPMLESKTGNSDASGSSSVLTVSSEFIKDQAL